MDSSIDSKENMELSCDEVESEQEKNKNFIISLESDTLSSESSYNDVSQAESQNGKRFRSSSTSSDTSDQVQQGLRDEPHGSKTNRKNNQLPTFKLPPKRQLDEVTIQRRIKQIEYGKNTAGYDNYRKLVPKHERKKTDPRTPEIYAVKSRRGFDNEVKNWRRALHFYDNSENKEQ